MDKSAFKNWLVSVFPDFERRWESGDNCSKEGDGYTVHGVCVEFTHYYRQSHKALTNSQKKSLFDFIEECIANDPNDKDQLANALCTCFLENIAGEEPGEASAAFMGKASRTYYAQWNK
jgi:hypothetical protein